MIFWPCRDYSVWSCWHYSLWPCRDYSMKSSGRIHKVGRCHRKTMQMLSGTSRCTDLHHSLSPSFPSQPPIFPAPHAHSYILSSFLYPFSSLLPSFLSFFSIINFFLLSTFVVPSLFHSLEPHSSVLFLSFIIFVVLTFWAYLQSCSFFKQNEQHVSNST